MPITRGIQCAYCPMFCEDDYILDLHYDSVHKDRIKESERRTDAERTRKRRD